MSQKKCSNLPIKIGDTIEPVGVLDMEVDISKIDSPTLARLIEEVRNEENDTWTRTIEAYNRFHNRHNRSGGGHYNRFHNRHNRSR